MTSHQSQSLREIVGSDVYIAKALGMAQNLK